MNCFLEAQLVQLDYSREIIAPKAAYYYHSHWNYTSGCSAVASGLKRSDLKSLSARVGSSGAFSGFQCFDVELACQKSRNYDRILKRRARLQVKDSLWRPRLFHTVHACLLRWHLWSSWLTWKVPWPRLTVSMTIGGWCLFAGVVQMKSQLSFSFDVFARAKAVIIAATTKEFSPCQHSCKVYF